MSTHKKARVLGEKLLGAVPECARFVSSWLVESQGLTLRELEQTLQQLVIELLVLYMHIL